MCNAQVYFPIEMHIIDKQIPRWSRKWILLQALSLLCLMVSIIAMIGSIAFVVNDVKVSASIPTSHCSCKHTSRGDHQQAQYLVKWGMSGKLSALLFVTSREYNSMIGVRERWTLDFWAELWLNGCCDQSNNEAVTEFAHCLLATTSPTCLVK